MRSRGYDGRWRHLGVFTTRPADVLQFLLIVVAIGAGPWVLELLR
jgi:hypothetical protein